MKGGWGKEEEAMKLMVIGRWGKKINEDDK